MSEKLEGHEWVLIEDYFKELPPYYHCRYCGADRSVERMAEVRKRPKWETSWQRPCGGQP